MMKGCRSGQREHRLGLLTLAREGEAGYIYSQVSPSAKFNPPHSTPTPIPLSVVLIYRSVSNPGIEVTLCMKSSAHDPVAIPDKAQIFSSALSQLQ
jgi:hypothetical protein